MAKDAEIERYCKLCACVYQAAGAYDMPTRFLDALSDAAQRKIEARQKTDTLIPCDTPNFKTRITKSHITQSVQSVDVEKIREVAANLRHWNEGICHPALNVFADELTAALGESNG